MRLERPHQRGLVLGCQSPETRDDSEIAQVSGRHEKQFGPRHENPEARDNGSCDMKQRKRCGQNIAGRVSAHESPTKRGNQLAAMGMSDQFWFRGCFTSVKIRCHIIAPARFAKD